MKEEKKIDETPNEFKDDIKTGVKKMSEIIKEKLIQLNDLATMEIMLDASVRMRNRLESIRKMASASHIKVQGQWKTTPPKMHIKGLTGKKINNDEYEIKFEVYEVDEKGEKKLYENQTEVTLNNGDKIKRTLSADYKIAYNVTEKIKTGKQITREVILNDNI